VTKEKEDRKVVFRSGSRPDPVWIIEIHKNMQIKGNKRRSSRFLRGRKELELSRIFQKLGERLSKINTVPYFILYSFIKN
jgi:hypothetical protein